MARFRMSPLYDAVYFGVISRIDTHLLVTILSNNPSTVDVYN